MKLSVTYGYVLLSFVFSCPLITVRNNNHVTFKIIPSLYLLSYSSWDPNVLTDFPTNTTLSTAKKIQRVTLTHQLFLKILFALPSSNRRRYWGEKWQAIYVWRNIETSCCKYYLYWKSNEYNISWVCVCSPRYPACNAHASYYIVICGLPRSTTLKVK